MASVVKTVEDVVKSASDKKLYRHIVLENGLSALLISDPEIHVTEDGPAPPAVPEGGAAPATRKRKHRAHEDEEPEEEPEEDDDESMDDAEGSSDEEGSSSGEDSEGGSSDSGSGSDASGSGSEEEDDEDEDGEGGRKGKGGSKLAGVKKAAAAMAVGIGSLSDPPNLQGLSHYLEHMLFMGSAKYPDENEYDDFLTKNGGSSNAFTELEVTNYHFEVAPNALHGALDRFAQFFISPLCLESSLEREVQAVDSEFSGVLQSDACRASQLICHTCREGHAYRQFSWGNKKSLWDLPREAGVDIRGAVMDYYRQHYSAERMCLVVLGGEPLDTLQAWVLNIFAALPSGKGPRPSFKDMGMPFKGRCFYAMPAVRDMHEVSLTFQLPPLHHAYPRKAEHYISHLVGHEGPGSLLSLLKAKGWATDVCAGVEEDGYSQSSGCSLFSITITLTDAGLEAGPGYGLAAVAAAFEYLGMLRATGPQEWVWQELKSISDMKFMFQEEQEPMDCCTHLASAMHVYPPEHVVAAEYLHLQYDPQLVRLGLGD